MKIEEKFNVVSAPLIDVQHFTVRPVANDAKKRIHVRFAAGVEVGIAGLRSISMHMTAPEALELALRLTNAARATPTDKE